jgi:hypothetical protein
MGVERADQPLKLSHQLLVEPLAADGNHLQDNATPAERVEGQVGQTAIELAQPPHELVLAEAVGNQRCRLVRTDPRLLEDSQAFAG